MCKTFIKLSACPAKDTKCEELDFDKEQSWLPEFNPVYGTLRLYGENENPEPRAVKILDNAIADWQKHGYALRCAPKTIDTDNHNWRRIARVGKPGKPSVCLQVVIDGVEAYFDPWMY